MSRLISTRKANQKILRPVRANVGIEAEYRRALTKLIDEMNKSIQYWIEATYRGNPPEVADLAQDELSSAALRAVIQKLARRWTTRFDDASKKLGEYFAKSMSQRTDAALKKILKDGGFTVEFKMTRPMRDVLNATISEQVGLIKSIPERYLTQVEGIVMRGVQTGYDLHQISTDLQKQFGVTKRRAAFIARDQANKANATMSRVRLLESGITEAIWVHSGGGAHPRPTHLRAGRDRQRYDVSKGWYDPHEAKFIQPGELPNCRCFSRPVIAGMKAEAA